MVNHSKSQTSSACHKTSPNQTTFSSWPGHEDLRDCPLCSHRRSGKSRWRSIQCPTPAGLRAHIVLHPLHMAVKALKPILNSDLHGLPPVRNAFWRDSKWAAIDWVWTHNSLSFKRFQENSFESVHIFVHNWRPWNCKRPSKNMALLETKKKMTLHPKPIRGKPWIQDTAVNGTTVDVAMWAAPEISMIFGYIWVVVQSYDTSTSCNISRCSCKMTKKRETVWSTKHCIIWYPRSQFLIHIEIAWNSMTCHTLLASDKWLSKHLAVEIRYTLELRQLRGSISNTLPAQAESSWCKTPGGETNGLALNMRTFFSISCVWPEIGSLRIPISKNMRKITTWRWVLEYSTFCTNHSQIHMRYRSSGSSNTRFFRAVLSSALQAVVQCIFPSSHLNIPEIAIAIALQNGLTWALTNGWGTHEQSNFDSAKLNKSNFECNKSYQERMRDASLPPQLVSGGWDKQWNPSTAGNKLTDTFPGPRTSICAAV